MKVVIEKWEFVPETELGLEDGETIGFTSYRFTGTLDGQPFCSIVSFEIDGRDVEVEHVSGAKVPDGGEEAVAFWDAFWPVSETLVGLNDDMQKRVEEAQS